MKNVNVLVHGGITPAKFQSAADKLKARLRDKGIDANISFASSYEVKDVTPLEPGLDVIVTAGTHKVETSLPVVPGMALLYDWMGGDELVDQLAVHAK